MSMSYHRLLGYEFDTAKPYSESTVTSFYFALMVLESTPAGVTFVPILMFF